MGHMDIGDYVVTQAKTGASDNSMNQWPYEACIRPDEICVFFEPIGNNSKVCYIYICTLGIMSKLIYCTSQLLCATRFFTIKIQFK